MLSLRYFPNIFLILCHVVGDQFHLYYMDKTDQQDSWYDCLYYRVSDTVRKHVLLLYPDKEPYEIIPYCVRPGYDAVQKENQVVEGDISIQMTFENLREIDVTTLDLLRWSSDVSLVELYDEYLTLPFNVSLRLKKFSNCSNFWFGSSCQYTFKMYPSINVNLPFYAIVNKTFLDKFSMKSANLTCYTHLECNRGPKPACLDWRDICDGKVDCFDNDIDEIGCFELEMNECEANEFRCHDGLCIPEEFFNDGIYFADCLDRTDEDHSMTKKFEIVSSHRMHRCVRDPGFWCEEFDRARHTRLFVCTDGEHSDRALLHTLHASIFSSCYNSRDIVVREALLSYTDQTDLTYDCWFLLYCATVEDNNFDCSTLCDDDNNDDDGCFIHVADKCPTSYAIFPQRAIFQGHVKLVYQTNRTFFFLKEEPSMFPDYICYDVRKCPFLPLTSLLNINGTTCRSLKEFGLHTFRDIHNFFQACLIVLETDVQLTSSLFQCPGTSKYISKHRILDGRSDCYKSTDEYQIDACLLNNNKYRFKCPSENKCISHVLLRNYIDDCSNGEDERLNILKDISYSQVCNGYQHLSPTIINETDETHCDNWPCNNIYTRCDGAWNCLNGADELNCQPTNCSRNTHECVSVVTRTIICLPIEYANNGIVDCLGATDERLFCREMKSKNGRLRYKCQNESFCAYPMEACRSDVCRFEDGLQCSNNMLQIFNQLNEDVKLENSTRVYFTLDPSITENENKLANLSQNSELGFDIKVKFSFTQTATCNRGILIYTGKNLTLTCLCPPSYYGNLCQYQSQRVSLSIEFSPICEPDCTGIYAIILILLDEDHTIHDYEQLTYVPTYKCADKFFINLLYRSRPKNHTKTYYIRIEAYNKIKISYHSSWILPVKFLFLPVNRISAHLHIPAHRISHVNNCSKSCIHGQCITYVNRPTEQFCRCFSNWSGISCAIPLSCNCAQDSYCYGQKNNRSICICPLNKYGPRCRLLSICRNDTCQNGGTCISDDPRISLKQLICICRQGFSGTNCQWTSSKIEISFQQIDIPRSLRIHFITIRFHDNPSRTTVSTKIPYDRDTAIVHTSIAFHLIIIQILTNYYLAYSNASYTYSPVFNIVLTSKQQCLSIEQLFSNQSILTYSFLYRVKYYPLFCQNYSQLKCLYDDGGYMCLCNEDRFANCFPFDFQTNFTCKKIGGCLNDAQCFPDRLHCPYSIFCACTDCFYGSKCQFTSKGFGLSLDAILAYHIRPKLSIIQQPIIIKISITLTVVMFVVGLLNSITSIFTFRQKKRNEPGCRQYLLAIAIVSLCITILLAMKFLMLMLSELAIITNMIALKSSCISIDFLIRLCLIIADWLAASVSAERVLTITLRLKFNKKKSKKAAKWTIGGIILIATLSILHDPLYRTVIYDEQEDRRWCFVQYPSTSLQIYNSIINILHFSIPFVINFLAGIIIIFIAARTRSAAHPNETYSQVLREQFNEHKHLIISSISLVILATPRLIISFISGCMKSPRHSSLYLAGYFISFIPSWLTFFVFILPSKMYMKDWRTTMRTIRIIFKRQSS